MEVDSAHITDDTTSMAALYKALGNPVRLRIAQVLAHRAAYGIPDEECCGEGEVCVCRMTSSFDLSMPTISHHLKVLRKAGLVRTRRDGVWIYYSLIPERLNEAAALLESLAGRAEALSAAGSKPADPSGDSIARACATSGSPCSADMVGNATLAEGGRTE
jgi:ArsR family transcriptional regulator